MQYSFADFYENNAWLICRVDTQVGNQPVDIYLVMELPSGTILAFETVEDHLSQAHADILLKLAKAKIAKLPRRVILTKGDPAELYLEKSCKNLRMNLETVPGAYLEKLISPLKQSFGESFFSPSAFGYTTTDDTDELDRESAKRMIPDSYDLCPCASGKKYKFCCKKIFWEIVESMAAAEEKKISKALEWINKAKAKVGETPEVLCRESIIYSYIDPKKSELILNQCLTLNPTHPRAHYIRGLTFKQKGDLQSAIIAYETAISNYPQSAHYYLNEAYNNLGTVFYEIGNLVKAKSAWEKALLFLPSDKTTRKNLAEFIYNRPVG